MKSLKNLTDAQIEVMILETYSNMSNDSIQETDSILDTLSLNIYEPSDSELL